MYSPHSNNDSNNDRLLLSGDQLAGIVGGTWIVPPWQGWRFRGFSHTPTRVRPGDIVIQAHDGGRFTYGWTLAEIERWRGCPVGVVAHSGSESACDSAPRIEVPDLYSALEQLASVTTAHFAGSLVAVTGSVGKTSTCKLLNAVLSGSGACLLNGQRNLISGVLASAASLTFQDYAIIEVAASAIPLSVPLIRTQICVITHIAEAHTEQFGDLDGVAQRKSQLLRSLQPGALAVLNQDMPRFKQVAQVAKEQGARVISYGGSSASDYCLEEYDASTGVVSVRHGNGLRRYSLGVRGEHMAVNAAAVIAVSDALEVEPRAIDSGLRRAKPVPGRGNLAFLRDQTGERVARFINAAYNANEVSVAASLNRFSEEPIREGARRILVLGDMLELGEVSLEAHRRVGALLARSTVDIAVYVGHHADAVLGRERDDSRIEASDPTAAAHVLDELLTDGDVVLMQASNGVGLHEITGILQSDKLGWRPDKIDDSELGPAWAVSASGQLMSWRGRQRMNPGRLVRLVGAAALLEERAPLLRPTEQTDAGLSSLVRDADVLARATAAAGIDPPALAALGTTLAARLGMSSTVVVDPVGSSRGNRTTVVDLARLGEFLLRAHGDVARWLLPMDRRAYRLYARGYRGCLVAGSKRAGYHALTLLPSATEPRALVVGGGRSRSQCIDLLTHLAENELT